MSRPSDLAAHLRLFAALGVEGVSRDRAWRERAAAAAPDAEQAPVQPSTSTSSPAEMPPALDSAAALAAIRADIGDCTRCVLHTLGRKQVVFGVGNANADLMFV